jgi:hypothetical protein
MPLRYRYPMKDRIFTIDDIVIGDMIAFYDENDRTEVHAKVVSFPEDFRQYLCCTRINGDCVEVINFHRNHVYKINRKE